MPIAFAAWIAYAALFSGIATAAEAPLALTVAQMKSSPPVGKIVRVTGYVASSYLCPPCPVGAECKPCMSESRIYVSDEPRPGAPDATSAPTIAIAVSDPAQFERGKPYRFEIAVNARAPEGADGRLLRSEPADQPAWTTPSP